MGTPLKEVFENNRIDAVVHCAFNKNDIDNRKNAGGTIIWAEQAEHNNVGLQIFMSSLSADKDAAAPYGEKKYEAEKWFLAHNHVILRPGLVIGNGGLFNTIVAMVKKSPVIPLIDSGRTIAYVSDIDTISSIIRDLILHNKKVEGGKVWSIQQETPLFLGDILKEIGKQCRLSRLFIPIPYFILSILLNLGEMFKFKGIGVNTNNLKGIRQFSRKKYTSDLGRLGYMETPINVLIKKALSPPL